MVNANPLTDTFLSFIESGIQKETVRIMEEYKEKMAEDLERARQNVVANAALSIQKHMSVTMDRDNLIITIQKVGSNE